MYVLISSLSSQLGPEDYREHVYTCLPEEVDIDVSSALPFYDFTVCKGSHISLSLSLSLYRRNLAGCVSWIKL